MLGEGYQRKQIAEVPMSLKDINEDINFDIPAFIEETMKHFVN
jgi:hypothetical protein